MSKKHLLPPGNEEYLDRLGLTRQDKRVYIATLDSGLVSVGEIVQLTELSLGKVLESIRDLVDIGLIKKAEGRMPRYYSTLPFFRETMSIEKESIFSLDAMINSIESTIREIKDKREQIKNTQFKSYSKIYMDQVFHEIIQPFLDRLEELNEDITQGRSSFDSAIQKDNVILVKKILDVLNPLETFSKLQGQKFDVALLKEKDILDNYLSERKSHRMTTLKQSHEALSDILKNFNKSTGNFGTHLTQQLQQINLIASSIVNGQETLSQVKQVLDAKIKELKSTSADSTKFSGFKKEFKEKLLGKLSLSADPEVISFLDETFNQLVTLTVGDSLKQFKEFGIELNNTNTGLQNGVQLIDQATEGVNTKGREFNKEILTESKKMETSFSDLLNNINQKDEELIAQLKSDLIEIIEGMESKIKSQGSELVEKIERERKNIEEDLSNSFATWQSKMVELLTRPSDTISLFVEKWINDIKPIVDEFLEQTEKVANKLLEPIETLENESFATLTRRTQYIKAMIEGRTIDLQSIMDFSKEFDYTKISDTWVVVGLPSIYASLTDLLLRTKVKVTVVTPKLDLQLIETTRSMRSTIRITFVADIDKERDKRLLKKIEEIGRIQLRAYTGRNLFACQRDDEEIVFGYEQEGEEMIGIRSSTPSIIDLLVDRLNETVIRNSKSLN